MSAKKQLLEAVEHLSEAEAEATLEYIVEHRGEFDTVPELRDQVSTSAEPTGVEDRQRRRLRPGLRAVAIIPAGLLMGLFFVAYFALLIIVVVVIVRG